jgi:hypothetical protein
VQIVMDVSEYRKRLDSISLLTGGSVYTGWPQMP